MGLFTLDRPIWLKVQNGRILVSAKEGSDQSAAQQEHGGVDGRLISLSEKTVEHAGVELHFRNYIFQDIYTDDRYNLSVMRGSSVDRSLLNCLANIEGHIGRITLSVWPKTVGDTIYTNSGVLHDGIKINWKYQIDEIPPIETVKVGDKEYKNPEKRDAFFDKIAMQIAQKLQDQYGDGFAPMLTEGTIDRQLNPASKTASLPAEEVEVEEIDQLPPSDQTITGAEEIYEPEVIELTKPLTIAGLEAGQWDGKRLGNPSQPIITLKSKDGKKTLHVKLMNGEQINVLNRFDEMKNAATATSDDLPF